MRDRFKRSVERLLPSQARLGDLFWPFARTPEGKVAPVRRKPSTTPDLVPIEGFGSNPGSPIRSGPAMREQHDSQTAPGNS